MASKFPNNIDDNVSIPASIDLVTPVKAATVNNIRDGLLAVQNELGVPQVSGNYGTVKARLDALTDLFGENGINAVQNNGTTIVQPVKTLNFTGPGAIVTNAGSKTANVAINISLRVVQESISVSNGQTIITLSQHPGSPNSVSMFIDGYKAQFGIDYTVLDDKVTYTGPALHNTDKVEFYYIISGGIARQETIAVLNPGQTTFTLSAIPLSGSAVEMYLNGLKQRYLLDYTDGYAVITWIGAHTMQVSDAVEFWYITDAGGGSGGGGGTSNLSAPTTPSQDGYVALGLNGDLTYVPGVNNGDALVWNSSLHKWQPGTVTGSALTAYQDRIIATAAQTSFTLSHAAISTDSVLGFINQLKIEKGSYSVSGTTVSYTGSYTIQLNDAVEFYYSA